MGVITRAVRFAAATAFGAVVLIAGTTIGVSPAHAEAPVDLAGSYVVDQAGVLDPDDEQRVEQSLDTLAAENGTNLFVVYVDSFSSPSDRTDWGRATAELNQLGVNDILLSVAVDDRLYDLSIADDSAVTAADQASLESDVLVPELRDSDWAGAATSLAAALGSDGADSGAVATPPGCSGPWASWPSSSSWWWPSSCWRAAVAAGGCSSGPAPS
nr:hypothetical protein GCM10025699_49300 [Microbacterium flavescens]